MQLYCTIHPMGSKNPKSNIEFYLTQLQYEFEEGRASAHQMVALLIERLKQVRYLNFERSLFTRVIFMGKDLFA